MPKFLSQIDTNKVPIKGLVAEQGTSAPSSPVEGQTWTDTTNHLWKYWNGSAWKDPLDRANHTGTQLANTVSNLAATVQGYRLDQFAAPTAAVSLGSQRINNLADPASSQDAATKAYVDNARAGIASILNPVRVVASTNINLASLPAAIDGVTLSATGGPDGAGDRFLVTSQTTTTQNGVYRYTGSGGTAVRASDADATGEVLDGTLVAVAEGTVAGSQYIQTATPAGAPGTWSQVWVQFNTGGTVYSAGNGLQLSSNTFAVLAADGSISVSGAGVTVGTVPVSKGGTNATSAAAARTNLGAPGIYTALLGAITAGSPVTVTHNLGAAASGQAVTYSLYSIDDAAFVDADVSATDANNLTVTSAVAFAANKIRVTVVG